MGMDQMEARRIAHLKFGGVEKMKEFYRKRRGLSVFETMFQDIRFAGRTLRKTPVVTLIIILSIAIGVSATTTVFCWINTIILNPLPAAPRSEQLAVFATKTQSKEYVDSSLADYQDYRDQSRSLAGLAAFEERPLSYEVNGHTQRVWAEFVSGNFFDVLAINPERGRFFLHSDQLDTPGAPPLVVLSHDFWVTRFGGDPSLIGKSVRLNSQDLTVIGIAQKEFKGTISGLSFDVWIPLLLQDRLTGSNGNWISDRKSRGLGAIARINAGVSLSEAQSEMNLIATRLAQTYPAQNAGIGAALIPLSKSPSGLQNDLGQLLNVLFLVSFAVLLIVCSNLANLLLLRATDREKELAIRMALGAGRGRILRQLITESLAISLAAAVLSSALTFWTSGLLKLFIPSTDLPMSITVGLDFKVFLFAFLLSIAVGLASGLAPALSSTKLKLDVTLKESIRGTSVGRGKRRLGAILAMTEVALAVVALIGAGLFIKSFDNITKVNPGFDSNHVLLVAMAPSSPGHTISETVDFYQRVRERVRSIPSVRAIGYASWVPLGLSRGSWEDIGVDGYTPRAEENMKIYRNIVDEDYFDAMRIPLVDGRYFTERDDSQHWNGTIPAVAIVNETFVKRFIGGGNAIGHRIRGWGKTLTVVGVVKDSKIDSPSETPQPYFYVPFRQFATGETNVILHVAVDSTPDNVSSVIQREIGAMNSLAYVSYAVSLREYIGGAVFKNKVAAALLTVLGMTALALAALGIYGVISSSVSQRASEIGIRLALGGEPGSIISMVIRESLTMTFVGIVLGIVGAALLSGLLSSLLFGVSAVDPGVYLIVTALLTFVAILACTVPALRAARIDPLAALRHD